MNYDILTMNRKHALASLAGGTLLSRLVATGAYAETTTWLPILDNSPWVGQPATASALRGRVVVVDVFTFECINCTRVVANLKRLRAEFRREDLAIVGVHTPEVPAYQANLSYVARNVRAQGYTWPVVLDNKMRLWNLYQVDAWPTQLVFDRHGNLRHRIVGDSQDTALDKAVRMLQ